MRNISKIINNSIFILIIGFIVLTSFNRNTSINEESVYVPDEETAIKVAEAIWLPIYGQEIYDSKPFVAKLIKENVWLVQGTTVETQFGGVPYIEIQKSDCKILNVHHDK